MASMMIPQKTAPPGSGSLDSFNALPLNSAGTSVVDISPDSSPNFVGFQVASIPEPSTAFLLILGVSSLMFLRQQLNRAG